MIVAAKKIVVHPNFDLTLKKHDIALIELDVDLDLDLLVAAKIDLAASVSALDLVNLDLSVSVVSNLLGGVLSLLNLDLQLSVLGLEQCRSAVGPLGPQITDDMICTSVSAGSAVGSCNCKAGCENTTRLLTINIANESLFSPSGGKASEWRACPSRPGPRRLRLQQPEHPQGLRQD